MNELRATFSECIKRTENVKSFRFTFKEKLEFVPGQFVQVIFDEEDRSNKGLNKYLSFSCAPGKDYFEVTKKISDSAFSKRLEALKKGDTVLFKGPMGKCVFDDNIEKIVFIVGGIGITPVISILEYIIKKGLGTDVLLLYANWTKAEIAFKNELDACQKDRRIRVVHAVVHADPKDPECFPGTMDKTFIQEHIPDKDQRTFFIFGPPGMTSDMKNICKEIGVKDDKILTESFVGYE